MSAPNWDITYTMSDQTGLAGKELERAAAAATPAHQYVPWILVDDVPLGEDILQPSLSMTLQLRTGQTSFSTLCSTDASLQSIYRCSVYIRCLGCDNARLWNLQAMLHQQVSAFASIQQEDLGTALAAAWQMTAHTLKYVLCL